MQKRFYINSLPYEIELTARVCHEHARQFLDSFTKDITIDEFTVLDTIVAVPDLSQADLARLILKGKAHTGRFLMSLEDKGYIVRKVVERNGKLIKVSAITEEGMALYNHIMTQFKPAINKFESIMSEKEIFDVIVNLRKFRESIEKVSKITFE